MEISFSDSKGNERKRKKLNSKEKKSKKNQRKIVKTKVSKLFETKYILRNHDISE